MAVREFLEKVQEQNRTVSRMKIQLERTQAEMVSLKSPTLGDKVQSSHQGDISDLLIRLEEREDKLIKELNRLLDMKEAAEALISLEEDETSRNILTYRYIEGKKWEWIAKRMKYTDTRWIQRKGYAAIDHIENSPLKGKFLS